VRKHEIAVLENTYFGGIKILNNLNTVINSAAVSQQHSFMLGVERVGQNYNVTSQKVGMLNNSCLSLPVKLLKSLNL